MMILIVKHLAWLERTLPDCESCQEQPKEDLDIFLVMMMRTMMLMLLMIIVVMIMMVMMVRWSGHDEYNAMRATSKNIMLKNTMASSV